MPMSQAELPRAEALKHKPPHLVARLRLYPTTEGGRSQPVLPGWGCPCAKAKNIKQMWDACPLLGDQPMPPGETRTVGFFFLSGEEAVRDLAPGGTFYLWEGRIIAEAEIVTAG
jgi:hypothetical protein